MLAVEATPCCRRHDVYDIISIRRYAMLDINMTNIRNTTEDRRRRVSLRVAGVEKAFRALFRAGSASAPCRYAPRLLNTRSARVII